MCFIYEPEGSGSDQFSSILKHHFSTYGFSLIHHKSFPLNHFIPNSEYTCSGNNHLQMNKTHPKEKQNLKRPLTSQTLQLTPHISSLSHRKTSLKNCDLSSLPPAPSFPPPDGLFQSDFDSTSQVLLKKSSHLSMLPNCMEIFSQIFSLLSNI